MKFRHFLIFSVVFALVAIGTSCTKPTTKNIVGKWQLTSSLYCDSDDPEWDEEVENDEVVIGDFREDGKCVLSENGREYGIVHWSLDEKNQTITFDGLTYNIKSFSTSQMVWHNRLAIDDEWMELQMTWKKSK